MNSWLHHHFYAFKVAIRRLIQTPFSSLSNIIVMAFVLALPLIASAVLVSVKPVTQDVSVDPTISLFMAETTSLKQTQQIAEQLNTEDQEVIKHVEVVDKEQALQDLKDSPSWAEAIQSLTNNPLPHAIIVTLSSHSNEQQHSEIAFDLVNKYESLEGVDLVQFDSEWVKKLDAVLYFIKVIMFLLAVGVLIVVVATVFNTVRMQALVQRDEIAVARLVGATESFVRRPFLYFGAITGLIAGLVAIGLSTLTLKYINHSLENITHEYEKALIVHLPDAYWLVFSIALAMVMSAIAARWSVTRHSKF